MSKTQQEYHDAVHELQVAQQQFDAADPEYVDIAVYRLQAAEERIGVLAREMKGA